MRVSESIGMEDQVGGNKSANISLPPHDKILCMTIPHLSLRGVPLSLLVRAVFLMSLMIATVVLATSTSLAEHFNEEQLMLWLAAFRQAWWSPVLLLGLYVLTSFGLPAGPLLIVGASFGVLYGSIYNVAGLLLAAITSFLIAKVLGRAFVVHITGNRLRRAERNLHRFGFWPLVQTRFLPFPASVVNFGAALTGVPLRLFLAASVVGFLPSTVIHTYFIAELMTNEAKDRILTAVLYLGAFVIFNLVIGGPWIREQLKRRKRYQQLCHQRAMRRQSHAHLLEIVQT